VHCWGFDGGVEMHDGGDCGRVEGVGMFMWNGDPHDHAIWDFDSRVGLRD